MLTSLIRKVFSYGFLDVLVRGKARLSIWPNWNWKGETPKSTTVPLSGLEDGALEFSSWKEIGEEFLATSTGNTGFSYSVLGQSN